MPELKTLRSMLKDRNLQFVARETGINPSVLYRLMDENSDPKYETVRLLLEYFNKQRVNENV